ncbi:siderophore-interacting protein [Methylorubrum suomiense]
MRRITLTGPDLDGFASPGFDDHVKMFFAAPGHDRPVLPETGPDGLVFPETGPQPLGRDFTPRRYDPEARELDIDFALLHEGPASRWAAEARPGIPPGSPARAVPSWCPSTSTGISSWPTRPAFRPWRAGLRSCRR